MLEPASTVAVTRQRRAYVVGAWLLSGGPFMAYHLGRILQLDFGFQGVAVTVRDENPSHGIFHYDPIFPTMTVAEMEASITDDDVLIANPSFSRFCFGLRCRGLKVMYVQGFTTFSVLDGRFDLYVSVSQAVRRFLATTWDIETEVVPPFIAMAAFPLPSPWRERPPDSFAVLLKGEPDIQRHILDSVRQRVCRRHPQTTLEPVVDGKIPQRELIERIGRVRHFVSLSVAEGFGLVPLEAMAMGTTVLGFDGFGGREYMRPGVNCAVSRYPDIEGVADRIGDMLDNPAEAERLAAAGRLTASDRRWTYERFRDDWRQRFTVLFAREGSS